MLCAECHQRLSGNVSNQSAGDRINSYGCCSGNEHLPDVPSLPVRLWADVTGNVFPGYDVLCELHHVPHHQVQPPLQGLLPSYLRASGVASGPVCQSPWPLLHVQMLLANHNQSWCWNPTDIDKINAYACMSMVWSFLKQVQACSGIASRLKLCYMHGYCCGNNILS